MNINERKQLDIVTCTHNSTIFSVLTELNDKFEIKM